MPTCWSFEKHLAIDPPADPHPSPEAAEQYRRRTHADAEREPTGLTG